jgi:hypothetical protein
VTTGKDLKKRGIWGLNHGIDTLYLQAENSPHCRVHFGNPTQHLSGNQDLSRRSPMTVFWGLESVLGIVFFRFDNPATHKALSHHLTSQVCECATAVFSGDSASRFSAYTENLLFRELRKKANIPISNFQEHERNKKLRFIIRIFPITEYSNL